MAKVKYYYDSETLSYKRVRVKKSRKFGIITLSILSVFLSGFLVFLIYLNIPFLESPKEKVLRRELNNLELQYDLLNRKMDQAGMVLDELMERDNTIYRVYFESNPIPEEQRRAGFGGVNRYRNLEGFDNSNMIIATNRKLDILTRQIVVQSKSLDEIIELAKNEKELLAAIPAIQPVRNEDMNRMASGYGYRTDPFTKIRKFHGGMDFSAPRGTPVFATGDGVVKRVDGLTAGYGRHIRIDHGYGYVTLYAHLNEYNVRRGQRVKRGDTIGYVGSSGRSTGPHLHYEVLKNDQRINPMNFYYGSISAEEYAELLERSQEENQSLD
ncbi:MAG TPA: M23 family metallopeptidase [Flavobacteriaceae bacterium]|nr:M23 family metallopeptidase [Flavobacteriaceae bacterium]